MQAELYFTGFVAQGDESPTSIEMPERTVHQGNVDPVRRSALVLGAEMLPDMVVVDVQRGVHRRALHLIDGRPAAPGHELRVIFHSVHQLEHLFRRVRNQYRFLYQSHALPSRQSKAGRISQHQAKHIFT